MTFRPPPTHPSRLLLVFALATSSTWAIASEAQAKAIQVSTTNQPSALAQVDTLVDRGIKTSEAGVAEPAQSAPPAKAALKNGDETSDPLLIALAGLSMAVAIVQRRSKRR